MSNSAQGVILSDIEVTNTLPAYSEQPSSEQLYVSLSDLIMEHIFYHPAVEETKLSETDKETLVALLNGLSVNEHFVQTLVSKIKDAISSEHRIIRVRLSHADSYAFSALLGGGCEEKEVNPAMGLRGVGRYASSFYASSFALECEVVKRLRADGHDIEVVVPFVRALSDAATIIDRLAEQGLPRGLGGLKVLYSCDVPSSILLADKLLQYFDGVVIDIESLAQFILGVDIKNEALTHSFDIQNEAVIELVIQMIKKVKKAKKPHLLLLPDLNDIPLIREALFELKGVNVAISG